MPLNNQEVAGTNLGLILLSHYIIKLILSVVDDVGKLTLIKHGHWSMHIMRLITVYAE
jgi:hypothetical protein